MTVCPLSPPGHDLDCEYCSDESYMQIKDACNVFTHRRVMIKVVDHRGLLCNNAPLKSDPWIVSMKVCPKTLQPVTMEIKKPVPGKAKVPVQKPTRKQLQERTERELTKLRSPSPNHLVIPDSSKKSKKRPGQQTLGDVIEI